MGDIHWEMFGASVRGAGHSRDGRPNQDCVGWAREGGAGVLATADGHGSARSFRSDRGSRFAVQASVKEILSLIGPHDTPVSLSAIKRMAATALPQAIVRRWIEAVDIDLQEPEGEPRDEVGSKPLIAYGSTILAVGLTESFAVYCQLGDGDILCVSDEGECIRPLDKDERLFANETTSLCTPQAWRDFRVAFQVFSERTPAMILLATDGYSNSFSDDSGFLKVGSDILDAIRCEGWGTVTNDLPEWLSETSLRGSGDDITVGLVVRNDIIEAGRGDQSAAPPTP
jgi:serine/threonine protein phosphatase PrpC